MNERTNGSTRGDAAHPFSCLASFFGVSLFSELLGATETSVAVKAWIVMPGPFLLIADRIDDGKIDDGKRPALRGRECAFAEIESGHSAVFLTNGRCAVHS